MGGSNKPLAEGGIPFVTSMTRCYLLLEVPEVSSIKDGALGSYAGIINSAGK